MHKMMLKKIFLEALLLCVSGVLTSSLSDGLFVITINMDENGSKVSTDFNSYCEKIYVSHINMPLEF